MKTIGIRLLSILVLGGLAVTANAAVFSGSFLTGGGYSLVHAGSTAGGLTGGGADHLRWVPTGQPVVFDLTGTTLTYVSGGPYALVSDNGDTGTFTINSFSFDLSGPNGFAGGTMGYDVVIDTGPFAGSIIGGTFVFPEKLFAPFPFNTSNIGAGIVQVFAWGGDDANDFGIDFGMGVPIPGALVLFGSALFGLGAMRKRA